MNKTTSRLSLVLAFAAMSAGSAFAQQSELVKIDSSVQIELLGTIAGSAKDLNVIDAAGKKLGEIEAVVGPDSKTPSAIVVDFDDGAGFGSNNLAVPLDSFTRTNGQLTLDVDPSSTASLPVYND